MSIEQLIKKIQAEIKQYEVDDHMPATLEEIDQLTINFHEKFKVLFPESYRQLLIHSNGIMFNGLTIWPTRKYASFRESLISANHNLQNSLCDEYIYFGKRDEELYIYNLNEKKFQAIEYVGQYAWQEFLTADEMLLFMLERSLD